jgi:predicted type IV restriction endonuclease
MTNIPSKVVERFKSKLTTLQKILEQAKNRDINEADTVVIVSDVLTDLFGYDKYEDVTREYAIKNNFCDLAVKIDGSLKFLIEVKAIGITLQDKHYQQALDYGANNGTEWIVLTNGILWKVYKVKFEKPIHTDFICEFNILEMNLKNQSDIDRLFILCKEGIKKNAIDEFSEHRLVVNKYFVGAILQSDYIMESIKRELKKVNQSIKPDNDEILNIIKNEILKRELLDSPEAIESFDRYSKILKKIEREKLKNVRTQKAIVEEPKDISEQTILTKEILPEDLEI